MLIRKPGMLLFVEDIWKKTLGRLRSSHTDHQNKSKMSQTDNPEKKAENDTSKIPQQVTKNRNNNSTVPSSLSTTTTTTTAVTNTTTNPSNNSNTSSIKKPCWKRKTVHFTIFLAVFSTILSLLWIYTLTAELRRKAFDANMTRDYVLDRISMDNPQLVDFIRGIQFKQSTNKEPLNATQTPEEEFVVNQLRGKREGIYLEYISRVGASSTTGWLESNLGWRGVMVLTDPRNFHEAYRSSRNPKTKILYACLSTGKQTKEITYHQETDVQITKLGEGPNSIVFSKETQPPTRLICFPLYTILLAYNATTIDYLSLDSTELQDELVLDTIPWDKIKVSILSIHWGPHHTETETKSIIDKMNNYNYKAVKTLDTSKLIFLYNRRLKI